MTDYDRWLERPYIEQAMEQAKLDKLTEDIFNGYDKKALLPDYIQDFPNREIEGMFKLLQDAEYEKVGLLMWNDYIDWLWECAEIEAERTIYS